MECVCVCSPALAVLAKEERDHAQVERGAVRGRPLRRLQESRVPPTDVPLAEHPPVRRQRHTPPPTHTHTTHSHTQHTLTQPPPHNNLGSHVAAHTLTSYCGG